MLCGIATTTLIPETKRKTLEELAGEVPGMRNYDPAEGGLGGKGSNEVSEKDMGVDGDRHV